MKKSFIKETIERIKKDIETYIEESDFQTSTKEADTNLIIKLCTVIYLTEQYLEEGDQ